MFKFINTLWLDLGSICEKCTRTVYMWNPYNCYDHSTFALYMSLCMKSIYLLKVCMLSRFSTCNSTMLV